MPMMARAAWMLLEGWVLFIAYGLAAIGSLLVIVLAPLSKPAWRMARYVLYPFGYVLVPDEPRRPETRLAAAVWRIFFGWWIALLHFALGGLWYLTVIGRPFADINFRLARLAFAPLEHRPVLRGTDPAVPSSAQLAPGDLFGVVESPSYPIEPTRSQVRGDELSSPTSVPGSGRGRQEAAGEDRVRRGGPDRR